MEFTTSVFTLFVTMSLKNGKRERGSPPRAGTITDTRISADKFPSSAAFDAINDALSSEEDKKDAIKQGNAVFAFTLKNAAGETESWHIDLKNKGTVGKGLGEKPNGKDVPFRSFQRSRR